MQIYGRFEILYMTQASETMIAVGSSDAEIDARVYHIYFGVFTAENEFLVPSIFALTSH